MNTAITITPALIVAICGSIITISGAATVIFNIATRIIAPNELQNKRLDEIELRLVEHERYFGRDLERLNALESGTRVTQKAILALLAHAIDGNDIASLKDAKKDLEKYLIER